MRPDRDTRMKRLFVCLLWLSLFYPDCVGLHYCKAVICTHGLGDGQRAAQPDSQLNQNSRKSDQRRLRHGYGDRPERRPVDGLWVFGLGDRPPRLAPLRPRSLIQRNQMPSSSRTMMRTS